MLLFERKKIIVYSRYDELLLTERERGVDMYIYSIYFIVNRLVWDAEFNLHNNANKYKDSWSWITCIIMHCY